MVRFEYAITKHPAEHFQHLVYFCADDGSCSLEQVPGEQTKILEEILNRRGSEGWDLVQVAFGRNGLLAFWKRAAG
ncbi:hypothetical protein [Desulfoglaeba alkanexedens]|jgi:hypothetical protein|uniref:DUF4177 domain-containing protein n=1 Tax=Desulfoglaeba alkanexedens ALDC TaxID=980445 RepID=A0A4P8L1W9_9BACT|nr:hypothetical protein [Desulfoglaeba alkanexedens]QCQ21623.1 hypothetical protein FDQ92_05180 [Desulfoglaeba alkanexedens ALDC]